MAFIEHRLGKTFFEKRGRKRASKAPLIFLHGGPGGHSQFLKDLFFLSDERQVFIYDQIGGGRSTALSQKFWNIQTFVKELDILIRAWELEHFHLMGGSWGATLALEYFSRSKKSKQIKSLGFQSPMFSAKDWQEDADVLIKKMPKKEQKIIQYCHEIGATDSKVYQDVVSSYYARHVCRNKSASKRMNMIKNEKGNHIYQHMWGASEFWATGTLKDYDGVNKLQNINIPALFLCGEHDEARPSTIKRYSKLAPISRFFEIKNTSHAILAENSKLMTKKIRCFLKDVENEDLYHSRRN